MNSIQNFYLKLKNLTQSDDDFSDNNEQIIAEFTVPQSTVEDDWANFEIIIAPNKTYGQLYWDLRRTISNDYLSTSDM